MDRRIHHYCWFRASREFVEWQERNPKICIISVMPVSDNSTIVDVGTSTIVSNELKVFVVYYLREECDEKD